MSSKTGKTKNKMSKAQIQLMIIKKKQCDSIAQKIVERLIEPNVDRDWLQRNLKYINKNHFEDVIEEREITKICGYVLCDKALPNFSPQKYSICTKSNKVFDVTKRKMFCSSACYTAANFLLEQMLISPLWLRNQEEVTEFEILSHGSASKNSQRGEELFSGKKEDSIDANDQELDDSEDYIDLQDNEPSTHKKDNEILEELEKQTENSKINNCTENDPSHEMELEPEVKERSKVAKEEMESSENKKLSSFSEQPGDSIKQNSKQLDKNPEKKKRKLKTNKITDEEKYQLIANYVKKVENNVKEWITEETIQFLSKKEAKQKIVENIVNREKHAILCKKLNHLQLDEKKERVDGGNRVEEKYKPLPDFDTLKEEGKKLKIKVKAFYKGNLNIEEPNVKEKGEEDESRLSITPMTSSQAPAVFRRRILLQQFDNTLPELIRALAGPNQQNYVYDREKRHSVEALVSTFSLSPTNIVFPTTQWSFVGLLMIKMLSLVIPEFHDLLAAKQASGFITMILMSYKLHDYYLDQFVETLLSKKNSLEAVV